MNKSRKTSNLYNVVTYDETGNIVVPAGLTLGTAPASSDNSTKAATTAWIRTYVSGLSYATAASVSTAIANLVDAAPTTLDTLNELAAALGDDPSFATTITASIGTKVPQARTITINGTAYDLSADRSWTIAAGLTSFNTRTGAITLSSADVTGALGFTPYNATNPSGYITGITSGNVTTALGFTPVTNARTITINGTAYDLSADRAWTISGSDSTKLPLAGGTLTGFFYSSSSSKIVVQGSLDGTSSRGIFMWNATDPNWGIYMSQAGAGKTIGDTAASAGIDGRTAHAIRFRVANSTTQIGFLWENSDEQALMQLQPNTGNLYTRGQIYAGNSTSNLVYHSGNLTNLNQLTNGPGYITGYTETSTLAAVTARGASTGTAIVMSGGSGTTATLVLDRNIATPSNYYSGLQLEIRATSGVAGIGLHRNGFSHVGIYQDSDNFIKFNMNNGTAVLGGNIGTVIGSGNYNSYSPTLTGGGASGTWGINITGESHGIANNGNAISGMGPISNWDSRPGVGMAGFGINWHTGVSISGYAGYGGVRLYASGYPTHAGSVLRLEASGAVYTYGGLYSDGNLVLHAGNYTSYTDGRYWLNNGTWFADFGQSGFSRIFGNETSGGGFAIMTNPNGGGQTSILIDGSYFSGENNGFYSLGAANQYSARRGWYNDGSTINFRTNNSVISTANIRVYPVSESWAEGLSFIMPTSQVWGGLRWQRERSGSDGNWYVGFTALDTSDDLVFGANNGGTQNDSIIRLTKAGLVSMQKAPGGANLMLGAIDYSRVYNDSDRSSLVINSPYYPHLYLNAMNNSGNGTHGPVISMSGILTAGGYRRWAMGIANTNPSHFSIGWADNNTNPHYGVGHDWSLGGRFVIDTSGNIWCTGDVTAYGAQSDLRLKTIKEKVPNALEGVLKLNGYRFDWKERDVKITTFIEDIGVVAQEVADVFPELARTGEDGWMSVRYQGLTAVLIEAVKEQQSEIEELKDLVKQLLAK